MTITPATSGPDTGTGVRRRHWGLWGLAGLFAISFIGFLLAPWSLQEKSLAALHGLCAQQPTHSFWFGDTQLPFDARMTGIYGTFAIVTGYLVSRGRLLRIGMPPTSLLVGLALFIVLMGIDGINSTLNDVGLPYVYEPSNHLRFVTGALTGTTLAVFTWLLASGTVWSPSVTSSRPLMRNWMELLPIGIMVFILWALIQLNWSILYAPIALALVLSAVTVVSLLTLVAVTLITGRIQRATRVSELTTNAVVAVILAYLVMSTFAGARFMLESVAVAS